MPDPIQVERLYQELRIHFESTLSVRHQYALFRRFIERLEGSVKKFETYIIQLLDDLSVYPNPLSWSGIDPEDIELDLALLETLNKQLRLSEKSENYRRISDNLEQICLLLFSCLNDASAAGKYLKKMYSFGGLSSRPAGQSIILNELYKLLSAKFQNQDNISREKLMKLERLIKQIDAIQKKENGKAFVPVAEKYNQSDSSADRYGRLRKIFVEHYGAAESDDELIWNMNLYGAEKPSILHKKSPLIAARRLYESHNTKKNNRFFKGGARFEITSAVHDGESANLAISALWYSRILEASGRRERYEIDSHTALTGDIDDEGVVLPVDDNTVSLKTKAVFFSWASMLVVPAIQRDAFEKELQKLQEKYPHRKLALIGIDQLEELFYDRRVATHILQGRIKYYFSRIRKEQKKSAFIPVIVFLLLIIARLMYGPVDRNPEIIEYEGSDIVLKNSVGATVKRLEVGEVTVNQQNNKRNYERLPLATLIDINDDGINELIYSNRLTRSIPAEPFVRAWSVKGDSLIWEKKIISEYRYPKQSAFMNFSLRAIEVAGMETETGPKIAINTSVIQYFQTVVFTIDALTGEIEQEYIHPGKFDDMYAQDLNNDGNDEIILTGINNAYWKAAAVVLEYGNANGYAPAKADYIPADTKPANEYRYMLIPKTILGKYFDSMQKYNRGKNVNLDELSRNMLFAVVEGRRELHGHEDDILVLFYFDLDLKPIGIGTSDLYDIVARELFEEGEIPFEPGFDYFESLQDSILYWTGNEFVTTQEYFRK